MQFSTPSRFRRLPPPTRPAFLTLFTFLIVFVCCIFYARLHFYRDPGSVFFDESRAFVRWYSAYRQEQAEAFIQRIAALEPTTDDVGPAQTTHPKAATNASICASFLTVQRTGQDSQYLDTSIGSALDRLTPRERQDLHLKVFFADAYPAKHPTWRQPWLHGLIDEVYSYGAVSPDALNQGQELDRAHDAFKKATVDYGLALRHCYDTTRAPYIAVFEDDIIIADGWLARALAGLREVEAKMTRQRRAGKWLYLRLFNQERSTGWNSRKIGGNNELPISLAISLAIWAVGFKIVRPRSRILQLYIDGWTIAVVCAIVVPAFVVLFYQCGKASLLPPSPGTREEFFGCCAQGIIFNREHIPGMLEYMQYAQNANWGEGQDMITRDYAWQKTLARWSLYPVVIQHIGVHSTIQRDRTESQSVWSMAFETLDPERLRGEHEEMVRRVYGAV